MNRRLFVWLAVGLTYFMVYQAWLRDHASPLSTSELAAPPAADGEPNLVLRDNDEISRINDASLGAKETLNSLDSLLSAARIKVETDVLRAEIDLQGGDLRFLALKKYPLNKKTPDKPVVLLRDDEAQATSIAQNGLLTADGPAAPSHHELFSSPQASYRLFPTTAAPESQNSLQVPLYWENSDGLKVTKTYVFYPNSYRIDVLFAIDNRSSKDWIGAPYVQVQRRHQPIKRSFSDVNSYSFWGPAIFDGARYHKLELKDIQEKPTQVSAENGWLAAIQHHFLIAVVPPLAERYQLSAKVIDDNRFLLSAVSPLTTVAAGGTATLTQTYFIGPKLQSSLVKLNPKLKLSVDYGFLTFLSQPLFWMLQKIHQFIGNWGWAIVIVTAILKMLFYKLTETSYRSMAKLRLLAPRMKALQERYPNDRQKLSQAMMEMYRTEKVNPMSGCLPLLLQMPVFLAFYWMLIETVELRQAPFFGWINDLSSRDPYFILPALMCLAMVVQYRLNPKPADPTQAKVFGLMPYIFAFMFAFFPSGLVLYWLVSTVLGVMQQQYINHRIEKESK